MSAARPSRAKFVEAYLGEASGNATRAAIIAGYSAKTADRQGSRLLKSVEVQGAILDAQAR
jgi:phage terminase small subunit